MYLMNKINIKFKNFNQQSVLLKIKIKMMKKIKILKILNVQRI